MGDFYARLVQDHRRGLARRHHARRLRRAADAYPWRHGHWRHGYGWGPGIAFGAIGAGVLANSCLRSTPVYDSWGNYVGRRIINVCY